MNLARTSISAVLASLVLFFGGVAPAGAQDCSTSSPTQDQYCPPSTITFQGSTPSSDPSSDPSASGGLPFTGYDLGLAALAAAALVGAGLGLHRAARAEEGP